MVPHHFAVGLADPIAAGGRKRLTGWKVTVLPRPAMERIARVLGMVPSTLYQGADMCGDVRSSRLAFLLSVALVTPAVQAVAEDKPPANRPATCQ